MGLVFSIRRRRVYIHNFYFIQTKDADDDDIGLFAIACHKYIILLF